MTKDTYDFIVSLFEWYAESSSGQEDENAAALAKAWDELAKITITP